MKRTYIAAILALLLILNSCGKMVDSYMVFSIAQFDEFLSVSDGEKGDYLAKGKLDFAKTGDVFFVPFIKETTHEECTIFVYAYWSGSSKDICITGINLVAQNDAAIFNDAAVTDTKIMWEEDTLSKSVFKIGSFPKSDDWFSNGNKLYLSYSVSVSTEDGAVSNEYVFEVTLHQTKNFLFPT